MLATLSRWSARRLLRSEHLTKPSATPHPPASIDAAVAAEAEPVRCTDCLARESRTSPTNRDLVLWTQPWGRRGRCSIDGLGHVALTRRRPDNVDLVRPEAVPWEQCALKCSIHRWVARADEPRALAQRAWCVGTPAAREGGVADYQLQAKVLLGELRRKAESRPGSWIGTAPKIAL